MALKNDIYLGPSGSETLLSPLGRKFRTGYLEFGRQDRASSGRGVKDIRALKRKFTLAYDVIDNAQLEVIKGYFELESELSLIVTNQNGSTTTYTVLPAPFDWDRLLACGNGLWAGLSLELEQV